MTDLPNGWQECSLDDIVSDISYGYTAKSNPDHGDARMLRITDIQNGKVDWRRVPFCEISDAEKERYLLGEMDLVFARTGATVGKSFLIREQVRNAVFASYLIRVRCIEQGMAGYLKLFFDSPAYWNQITEFSAGIAQPNVNGSKLKALRVPLAPPTEQKRIADKLDTMLARVDVCRERLERVSAILKRFRQSVLAAAAAGRLTKDWRSARQSGSGDASTLLQKVQEAKLKWAASNVNHNESLRVLKRATNARGRVLDSVGLPDTWRWCALEDAVMMVVDCHNKTAPYEQDGIPLVRTSNIRDRAIVWGDMKYVSEKTYAYWSRRCQPESGDLIFTREAPMGEVMMIPPETRVCLGQRTMLFRPVEPLISGQYVLWAVADPHFKSRSELVAVGTGVKHLRVGDVSELLLPIPPKDEQDEITRRVEKLFAFADSLEARLNSARSAGERLTPALLAKAFRGELVPQDPHDEPAAELLKRLAEQRSGSGAAVKNSRVKRGGHAMLSDTESAVTEPS